MPATHDRQHFEAMACPGSVTWTNDIAKLFTSVDVAHMKQVTGGSLDLSDYDSAKIYATQIYGRVASGSMPPPGTIGPDGKPEGQWTEEMVTLFGCWIQKGTPE